MTINDLNRDQLAELKADYYDGILMETENRGISYGEIAGIHDIVSDEEIRHFYGGVTFSPDDFACGMAA